MKLAHHAMTWDGWAKKKNLPNELDQMFREMKSAGYDGVELGGKEATLGKPAELQKRLADHGLSLAAFDGSVTANPWPPNTEDYQRTMDYAAALGTKIIMICGGFFGFGRRNTFESDYKLFAENLAAASQYAVKNGQTVAYHPHLGCMVETAEEVRLLLRWIPDLHLCIDTGHLTAVRTDPAKLIREYPKKIVHIHLKDWNTEAQQFAELGQGNAGLDFKTVLTALNDIKYPGWLTVERDNVQMEPLESARISRQFLTGIAGQS